MNLPYIAECCIDSDDRVEITVDTEVCVRPTGGTLYLSPKKARKLAKAIKLAADLAEARA